MKLSSVIALYASGSGMLPDDVGMNTVPRKTKKFKLIDTRYGTYLSSWDTEQEAKRAMFARPYSKVITGKIPGQYGKSRSQKKPNPDTGGY